MMIKFLIICTTLLFFYLGFSAISQLDTIISFTLYDYFIETSLFTVITFFVLSLFLVLIALKIIFLIFEFPYLIRKRLSFRKAQRVNHALMQSMSYLLVENKFKAAEISKRVESDLKPEHKELFNLILAESAEDFEKKIEYYRLLGSSKDYNYFSIKRMAEIFSHNGFYEQAEDYATRAFNINEFDGRMLEILIDCYANQKKWIKFVFIVSKLSRVDSKRLVSISDKVSEYYVQAAKDMLEKGEDQQAMNYIESALELSPGNIEALDVYLSLNLSLNQGSDNQKILRDAFILNPSFEIAEIYMKTSDLPPEQLYEELTTMVDSSRYRGLFLAIAAYLNLPHKIEKLTEPKLLTHYN